MASSTAHDLPTVAEILELPTMEQAAVIAGGAGLGRSVSGVNIVEVPDIHRWLRGGEFLFTAAYAFRDNPRRLAELFVNCDRIGVSGIGLKLGPYLRELPAEVSAEANRLGLPVVRVPSHVAYMDVIDPLYRRIAAHRLWELERSSETKRMLTSLALEDQSVEQVVGALAIQLKNPVFVLDLVDDTVVLAQPDGRSDRVGLTMLTGDDSTVVSCFLGLTMRNRNPMRMRTPVGDIIGTAVVANRNLHGRLVVLERFTPLDDVGLAALAAAAELLSFLVMQRLATIAGRADAAELFLRSLLADDLTTEEASERALTLGIRLTRRCTAIVIHRATSTDGTDRDLHQIVSHALSSWPNVVGYDGTSVLALVQIDDPAERGTLDRISAKIRSSWSRRGSSDLYIGVGSPGVGHVAVRRSRSEATIAQRIVADRRDPTTLHFNDLGVDRILSEIQITDSTRDYLKTTLGPIENDAELTRTLEVYLASGGRKSATAAALPLHRSSLDYRLEKIGRLLDTDLDDPERRLELWLALRLSRVARLYPRKAGDDARP